MQNKVLYFHGMGSGVERGNVGRMPSELGEIVAFNAPHKHGDAYKWFTNPDPRNPGMEWLSELKQSCEFIKQKICELKLDEKELTLLGASQGGFMALHLALHNIIVPKKVITIVPFYAPQLIPADMNKATPMLWINAEKDAEIPPVVANVYKDLQKAGVNLEFYLSPGSGHRHNTWGPDINQKMIEFDRKHR